MRKGEVTAWRVIALAYLHRYGWIATVLGLILIIPTLTPYILGGFLIVFSLWTFIGYKFKWKHIYCSYQNACRKTMTPHDIRWSQVDKIDVYGVPLIFFVLGLGMIIATILNL